MQASVFTALAGIDVPIQTLAYGVLAFSAGAAVPSYYAMERMAGFGRAALSKLPYKPPAGMEREQALAAASRAEYTGPTDGSESGGEADTSESDANREGGA